MIFAFLVIAPIIAISSIAEAAGGEGVPATFITFQAINFGLFCLTLGYLLKGPIKNHFKSREDEFTEAARKAELLKAEAEAAKKEIAEKLSALEASAKETVENAKKEAEALKANMMAEAKEMVAKIQAEAEKSTQVEVARAKEELRKKLLEDAITAAREAAQKTLSEQDQKRLHGEFVEKLQAVKQ